MKFPSTTVICILLFVSCVNILFVDFCSFVPSDRVTKDADGGSDRSKGREEQMKQAAKVTMPKQKDPPSRMQPPASASNIYVGHRRSASERAPPTPAAPATRLSAKACHCFLIM